MAKGHTPYSLGSMVRETETMKPTDKVPQGGMSNPAGCNSSEPTDSLVTLNHGGRALITWAKTASLPEEVAERRQGHHRGNRGDTLEKKGRETWETLPRQLSPFEWKAKSESYKAEPKRTSGREGVGAVHSSEDYRDSITRYSEGAAVQPAPTEQGGASDCRKANNGHLKLRNCNVGCVLKSKREKRCRYSSPRTV